MSAIEPYFPYLFLVGIGLAALSFLVLVMLAFGTRPFWGFGVLLGAPLFAPAYVWLHPKRGLAPFMLLILGLSAAAAPAIVTHLVPIDLGPRERIVDGERHLTLTGWDRNDYALLGSRPDTVVLQMANPDVDDTTLKHLQRLDRLRELDLSDTQVTDAGLWRLQHLKTLETLRLKGTKVTDDGLQQLFDSVPALRQLDLRETKVQPQVVEAWKLKGDGRRALR